MNTNTNYLISLLYLFTYTLYLLPLPSVTMYNPPTLTLTPPSILPSTISSPPLPSSLRLLT